jgi:L-ribulose-5-phosphate 3-epimerase
MNTPVGIMQGRLVPRYMNRYQAFPVDTWTTEFVIAKELGLCHIEFILDHHRSNENPLLTQAGLIEIQSWINKTGVRVRSICADYFMEAPFHSSDSKVRDSSLAVLSKLIINSAQLGVEYIVIPCVDQSQLKSAGDRTSLLKALDQALPLAEKHKIHLLLETDLGPKDFLSLVRSTQSNHLGINYDIGNSASLGFNPSEELDIYGAYVKDVHIKDRVLGGGSVMLGTGNANFEIVFKKLIEIKFNGIFVMQASRARNYSDDVAQVSRQLQFIRPWIRKYENNLIN